MFKHLVLILSSSLIGFITFCSVRGHNKAFRMLYNICGVVKVHLSLRVISLNYFYSKISIIDKYKNKFHVTIIFSRIKIFIS